MKRTVRAGHDAWLQEAAYDEHQVARVQASRRRANAPTASLHARRPTAHGAHRNGSATLTTAIADHAPALLTQLEALRRQQQRILHRSALIDYVLAAEKRGGEPLVMGDALAELLADITEAARTIGTILQTATERP